MIYLLFTLFFILLQGFFAGMETGMVSLMRPRVEHAARTGNSGSARILLFFVEHPGIMIATTLVGVNISVVCGSLMAKKFFAECGLSGGAGMLIATGIMSIAMLTCELIPKNWFRQDPFERCGLFVWALYLTYFVMFVPVRLFAWFTGFLNRRISPNKGDATLNAVMHEDFRLFLRESEKFGSVDGETTDILDKTMEINHLRLKDVMIPWTQTVAVSADATLQKAFDLAKEKNLTKLPVYTGDPAIPPEKRKWIGVFSVYETIFSTDEPDWTARKVSECLTPLHQLQDSDRISTEIDYSQHHKVQLFLITAGEQRMPLGILDPGDVASRLFE